MLRFIGARAHTCPPAETRESVPGGGAAPGVCVCVCVSRGASARVCVYLSGYMCAAHGALGAVGVARGCCLVIDVKLLCAARARGARARGARAARSTHTKKAYPFVGYCGFSINYYRNKKNPHPSSIALLARARRGAGPAARFLGAAQLPGGPPPVAGQP